MLATDISEGIVALALEVARNVGSSRSRRASWTARPESLTLPSMVLCRLG